jgi:hypothetical protein
MTENQREACRQAMDYFLWRERGRVEKYAQAAMTTLIKNTISQVMSYWVIVISINPISGQQQHACSHHAQGNIHNCCLSTCQGANHRNERHTFTQVIEVFCDIFTLSLTQVFSPWLSASM